MPLGVRLDEGVAEDDEGVREGLLVGGVTHSPKGRDEWFEASAKLAVVAWERHVVDGMPVSLLTVRHATHADVEHPTLGRISIDAAESGSAVDMTVRATSVETAAALAAIEPALRADFDKDALSLGTYRVDVGSDSSSSNENRGRKHAQHAFEGPVDEEPRAEPKPRSAAERRVRIVL